MASLKTRERQIANLEQFDVIFVNEDGRDTRSDLSGVAAYPYDRAARGEWTVAEWKQKRFWTVYPDNDCQVLDGDGRTVHGGTKLSTVRDTYLGD